MKTTTVQIKFDAEKYSALLRYAVKKDVSIEAELADTIDKLYKKLVPADVREFIEETETEEKTPRQSKVKSKEKETAESEKNKGNIF